LTGIKSPGVVTTNGAQIKPFKTLRLFMETPVAYGPV
jgi:hypothetical protein